MIICEKSDAVWPGTLREVGRSIAKYDWIHYLDTDDFDFPQHLEIINKSISNAADDVTLLFNQKIIIPLPENPNEPILNYLNINIDQYVEFYQQLDWNSDLNCKLASALYKGHNGTWQIVHHKDVPHRWRNSKDMGEDTDFIERLKTTEKYTTFIGQHVHCHVTYNRNSLWEI